MERVLLNKVAHLVEKKHYDITIVTTDQHGKPPFYPVPEGVRVIDLDINYSDDNDKGVWRKIYGYLKKLYRHYRRLRALLMEERADVVVSLYPSESSFIPYIKDGSKKVLELHYCKYFRLQYMRKGMYRMIDRLRTKQDERIVRKFDKFVVLTHEDRRYWGPLPNIQVIHNAALDTGGVYSDGKAKRMIAVGRLDYQKGFDMLLMAWNVVRQDPVAKEWRLDIFGQGEGKEFLQMLIASYGMQDCVRINEPTKNITEEYLRSSVLVMSSRYEGFPMVMMEAMAHGLPVVTFKFKCGPYDIIDHEENGLLVKNGDYFELAEALIKITRRDQLRNYMASRAKEVTKRFSEEKVMTEWVNLFETLKAEKDRRNERKGKV